MELDIVYFDNMYLYVLGQTSYYLSSVGVYFQLTVGTKSLDSPPRVLSVPGVDYAYAVSDLRFKFLVIQAFTLSPYCGSCPSGNMA